MILFKVFQPCYGLDDLKRKTVAKTLNRTLRSILHAEYRAMSVNNFCVEKTKISVLSPSMILQFRHLAICN